MGKIKIWERKGIVSLDQLYNGSSLKTFTALKEDFDIPNSSYYSYLQIKHALKAQFGEQGPVWSTSPTYERLSKSGGPN